jgi:hypothetical protein
LLAIVGWIGGYPLLTSLKPDGFPMAPSTAVLFVLLGTAVCLLAKSPVSRRVYRINLAIGFLGGVVSLILLVLSCTGIASPIEYIGLTISVRTLLE